MLRNLGENGFSLINLGHLYSTGEAGFSMGTMTFIIVIMAQGPQRKVCDSPP